MELLCFIPELLLLFAAKILGERLRRLRGKELIFATDQQN